MGIIWEIIKMIGDSGSSENSNKTVNEKLFNDEAKALGLTKEEIEECKKSGITPEEWAEENDPNYEN